MKIIAFFFLFLSLEVQADLSFDDPGVFTTEVVELIGREYRGQDDSGFEEFLVSQSLKLKAENQMAPAEEYQSTYSDAERLFENFTLDLRTEKEKELRSIIVKDDVVLAGELGGPMGRDEGSGTLMKLMLVVEQARIKTEAELETTDDEAERREIEARLREIEEASENLNQLVESGIEETRENIEELTLDLERLSNEVGSDTSGRSVKQVIFLKEALFSDESIDDRIEMIDHRYGPYRQMSPEKREELKKTLRKQQRIQNGLSTLSDGLVAAQDTLVLMNRLGVIDDEGTRKFEQGLAITGDLLQIGTGFASGNVFMMVSGVANLIGHMMGEEPQPDPDQVRHEQVMNALNQLQEGQVKILRSLSSLSKQINGQFNLTYSYLKDIKAITKTSMDLIIEGRLKGLRDCEQFMDNRKFFSDSRGFQNYQAFISHFNVNRNLYLSCLDFINDQIRGKGLNLLSVAANDDEAAQIERLLQKPSGWLKGKIEGESNRYALTMSVLKELIEPKYHRAILGSLVAPSLSMDEMISKLEGIIQSEEKRAYWERQYQKYELGTELKKFYNPNLILRMASVSEELLMQKLLFSPFEGNIYSLEQIKSPGFDPVSVFGGNSDQAVENFLLQVSDTEKLLTRAIAQHALYAGDLLVPLFHLAGYRKTLFNPKSNFSFLGKGGMEANYLLGKNKFLLANVLRYSMKDVRNQISSRTRYQQFKDVFLKRHLNVFERFIDDRTDTDEAFWYDYENEFFIRRSEDVLERYSGEFPRVYRDPITKLFKEHNYLMGGIVYYPFSKDADPAKNAFALFSVGFHQYPDRIGKRVFHKVRLPTPRELETGEMFHLDDMKKLLQKRKETRKTLNSTKSQFLMQQELRLRRSFYLNRL